MSGEMTSVNPGAIRAGLHSWFGVGPTKDESDRTDSASPAGTDFAAALMALAGAVPVVTPVVGEPSATAEPAASGAPASAPEEASGAGDHPTGWAGSPVGLEVGQSPASPIGDGVLGAGATGGPNDPAIAGRNAGPATDVSVGLVAGLSADVNPAEPVPETGGAMAGEAGNAIAAPSGGVVLEDGSVTGSGLSGATASGVDPASLSDLLGGMPGHVVPGAADGPRPGLVRDLFNGTARIGTPGGDGAAPNAPAATSTVGPSDGLRTVSFAAGREAIGRAVTDPATLGAEPAGSIGAGPNAASATVLSESLGSEHPKGEHPLGEPGPRSGAAIPASILEVGPGTAEVGSSIGRASLVSDIPTGPAPLTRARATGEGSARIATGADVMGQARIGAPAVRITAFDTPVIPSARSEMVTANNPRPSAVPPAEAGPNDLRLTPASMAGSVAAEVSTPRPAANDAMMSGNATTDQPPVGPTGANVPEVRSAPADARMAEGTRSASASAGTSTAGPAPHEGGQNTLRASTAQPVDAMTDRTALPPPVVNVASSAERATAAGATNARSAVESSGRAVEPAVMPATGPAPSRPQSTGSTSPEGVRSRIEPSSAVSRSAANPSTAPASVGSERNDGAGAMRPSAPTASVASTGTRPIGSTGTAAANDAPAANTATPSVETGTPAAPRTQSSAGRPAVAAVPDDAGARSAAGPQAGSGGGSLAAPRPDALTTSANAAGSRQASRSDMNPRVNAGVQARNPGSSVAGDFVSASAVHAASVSHAAPGAAVRSGMMGATGDIGATGTIGTSVTSRATGAPGAPGAAGAVQANGSTPEPGPAGSQSVTGATEPTGVSRSPDVPATTGSAHATRSTVNEPPNPTLSEAVPGRLAAAASGTMTPAAPGPMTPAPLVPATPAVVGAMAAALPLAGPAVEADPTGLVRAHELARALPQSVRAALQSGAHEAQIQLWPPELGSIRIHLRIDGDQVTARLVVERLEVRAMLEGSRGDLTRGLQEAGLKLHKLEISSSTRVADGPAGDALARGATAPPPSSTVSSGFDLARRDAAGQGLGLDTSSGQARGGQGEGQGQGASREQGRRGADESYSSGARSPRNSGSVEEHFARARRRADGLDAWA
jgi:hypothetical protein